MEIQYFLYVSIQIVKNQESYAKMVQTDLLNVDSFIKIVQKLNGVKSKSLLNKIC